MSNQRKVSMQRQLRAENLKYNLELVEIGPEQWPPGHSEKLIRVLRNRYFLVQIYLEATHLFRLTINRTTINAELDWEDGITWEELQALKDQAGFAEFDAVEVYPCKMDVVNRANIRHLWVLGFKLPFVWRTEPVPAVIDKGQPIGPGPLLFDPTETKD